jgi:hypothetical protein
LKLKKRKAQNLIEFVIVIPILIIIIFGIIEIAVFWRTVNTVQQTALSVAEAAASAYFNTDTFNASGTACANSTITSDTTTNPAVCKALETLQEKLPALGFENITFKKVDLGSAYGSEPFMFYEYQNEAKDNLKAGDIKIDIDYRDPYKNGVIVQMNYNYTTILLGCAFILPGGNEIVIIPKNIEVTSTKIQQYNQF